MPTKTLPPALQMRLDALPSLVSVQRAADEIDCHRTEVYKFIALGLVRAVKVGRSTKVLTDSLFGMIADLPRADIHLSAREAARQTARQSREASPPTRRGRPRSRALATAPA